MILCACPRANKRGIQAPLPKATAYEGERENFKDADAIHFSKKIKAYSSPPRAGAKTALHKYTSYKTFTVYF
jgi:hypothetical protein